MSSATINPLPVGSISTNRELIDPCVYVCVVSALQQINRAKLRSVTVNMELELVKLFKSLFQVTGKSQKFDCRKDAGNQYQPPHLRNEEWQICRNDIYCFYSDGKESTVHLLLPLCGWCGNTGSESNIK